VVVQLNPIIDTTQILKFDMLKTMYSHKIVVCCCTFFIFETLYIIFGVFVCNFLTLKNVLV